MKGVSVWYSGIRLNLEHLFTDYFEPEATYQAKVRGNYSEGSLLKNTELKLRPPGVELESPQLLMEREELEWSRASF
jgi:hypothetical protein